MPRKKPKNQKLSKGLSDLFRKGMSKSILPEEEGYGPDAYSKKGTGIARTPDGRVIYPNESESVGSPIYRYPDSRLSSYNEELRSSVGKPLAFTPEGRMLEESVGKPLAFTKEDGGLRMLEESVGRPLAFNEDGTPILSEEEEKALIKKLYPQSPGMKKLPYAGGKYYIYKGEDDMRPKKKTASSLLRYLQEVRSKR